MFIHAPDSIALVCQSISLRALLITLFFFHPQIGRSSESPIDFVVMDTVAGDKTGDTKVLQSTISRFACRILADRNDVNNCRIYAAGFDSSRNIFLGVSVT